MRKSEQVGSSGNICVGSEKSDGGVYPNDHLEILQNFRSKAVRISVHERNLAIGKAIPLSLFEVKATSLRWLSTSQQEIRNRPKRDFIDVSALPEGREIIRELFEKSSIKPSKARKWSWTPVILQHCCKIMKSFERVWEIFYKRSLKFPDHKTITSSLNALVYFAHSHCPWERFIG